MLLLPSDSLNRSNLILFQNYISNPCALTFPQAAYASGTFSLLVPNNNMDQELEHWNALPDLMLFHPYLDYKMWEVIADML
jgi:hypothetical protein